MNGLGINKTPLSSSSSGRKRKRHGETFTNGQVKRSRSGGSRRRSDITNMVTAGEDDSTEGANKYSVERPNATGLTGPEVRSVNRSTIEYSLA